MKICKNCNLENSNESKFCVGCGNKLENEIIKSFSCQKCGFENDKEVKFCTNCGMQLEVLPMVRTAVEKNKPCPACAYKNDVKAKLCRNCGFVLPEAVYINPEKSDGNKKPFLKIPIIGLATYVLIVYITAFVSPSIWSKITLAKPPSYEFVYKCAYERFGDYINNEIPIIIEPYAEGGGVIFVATVKVFVPTGPLGWPVPKDKFLYFEPKNVFGYLIAGSSEWRVRE